MDLPTSVSQMWAFPQKYVQRFVPLGGDSRSCQVDMEIRHSCSLKFPGQMPCPPEESQAGELNKWMEYVRKVPDLALGGLSMRHPVASCHV